MGITKRVAEEVAGYNDDVGVEAPDDWMQRINYVVKMHTRHCGASLYIYLETLDIAGLKLFVNWTDFGEGDLLRWIFRPKGLALRGGHKRNGTLRRLAKKVDMREINARKVTKGVASLWRIDNFFQGLGFWFMAVDLTTEFLYTWTTLIQQSEGCEGDHGMTDAPPQTLITLGGYQSGKFSTFISDTGDIFANGGGHSCSGIDVHSNAMVSGTGGNGPGSTTVTLRLAYIDDGGAQTVETETTVPPNEPWSLQTQVNAFGCTFVGTELKTVGPSVQIEQGTHYTTGLGGWNKN